MNRSASASKLIRLALVCIFSLASSIASAESDAMQVGRMLLAEGDHASAARSFSEAVRRSPKDASALNNLAVARAAGGDYQTAIELLHQAHTLAPTRTDIKDNLFRLLDWARSHGKNRATETAADAGDFSALPDLWPMTPNRATMTQALPTTLRCSNNQPCR